MRTTWRLLGMLTMTAPLALTAASAVAQSYPDKPIRLVVPFAPGGSNDVIGRVVAEKLGQNLGVPVVVENRPGVGGVLGSDIVAKAEPNGYTLLMGATSTMAVNPNLYTNMPFDPLKDLTSITQIASGPFLMAVPASLPVGSVQDFIALAKAKPDTLNFGSSGNGTSLHLTAELFKMMAGIDIMHVPYKGAGPALIDLISGKIHVIFSDMAALSPYMKSGQLKALAVTSAQPAPAAPGLPTIASSGVPGYEATSWYGLLGPAGMPPEIVSKLGKALADVVNAPAMRTRFFEMGIEPAAGTPQQFTELMRSEIEKWGKVVKASGAKVE